MIDRFVFHNDRVLALDEVRLSPGQAGLLSGWGLFTTIRIVEGIPFAFERHWKRLSRDAERTHCPFPFEPERVRDQTNELLRANDVREGCARIYVVHNQFGHWQSDESFPVADLVICSAPLPPHREPARLTLAEHGRQEGSPLAGLKVTSWLNNVWHLYEAQQAGYDEVVLLNERGEIAECTAANLFCVHGDEIATPPLSSGCLEGVTRSIVLEIGPPAGVPIEERRLYPEDLYTADEVLITSTNRGVISASEVHGNKIAAAPGPFAQKLEKLFANYVREYVDAHAAASHRR